MNDAAPRAAAAARPMPSPAPSPADVRAILIGAMLSMFLSALDQTIMAPALPTVARELGDFTLLSWIVTAYLLTSICVTPLIGKLSDLYGRWPVMATSLVIFMASSVLCALAPNMLTLIIARGLQGLGGGGLIPLAQTIVGDVISPRDRGKYAAYFSIVWASSAILGPTIGGGLTEWLGWPSIFWVNIPLGCLALVIVGRALRRLPRERHDARIDLTSSALLTGATVTLLLVLSLGGKRLPWLSPETLGLAVTALALAVLFIRRQARASEPIVPLRFLRDTVIRPTLAAGFMTYGCYLSVTVLIPIYLQVALGVSAGETGLLMIPTMLSSTVTANMCGTYSQRTARYKLPILLGVPVAIAGLVLFALLAHRLSPWSASLLLMLVGMGIGPTFPGSTVAVQNAVERRDLGTVSGALAFSRSLGAAIIIAAASALVLGLVAGALPSTGQVSSLEDLTTAELPEAARAAVATAFSVTFGALAVGLAVALAFFACVEERPLRGRPGE